MKNSIDRYCRTEIAEDQNTSILTKNTLSPCSRSPPQLCKSALWLVVCLLLPSNLTINCGLTSCKGQTCLRVSFFSGPTIWFSILCSNS